MSDTQKAMESAGKYAVKTIETITQVIPLIYSILFIVWYAYNENNDSFEPTNTWWSTYPNIYIYIWHGLYLFLTMLSFLKVRRIGGTAYDTKELKNVMTVYLITVVVTWLVIFYIKYLKQKMSDTFSNLSNASAATYNSVSSIGTDVTEKLKAITGTTEDAFCSELIVGDDLYDIINSIPVPNDIVDGFDFLNIKEDSLDLEVDLREPIKIAISPLNISVVGLKTLLLIIMKAVIALINVMTKIGILSAHILPATVISLSDFIRLCDKHGVVLAVLYTCTLLFGKTFVILVNAIFVFTPLLLALYVIFTLFEKIIYFLNPFEGPMGQILFSFVAGLYNFEYQQFPFYVVLCLMFVCIGLTVRSHIEHEIDDYNERALKK